MSPFRMFRRSARPNRRRTAGVPGSPVLLTFFALGLAGCSGSVASQSGPATAYGPAVPVGNGTARVYVTVSDGTPVEVGVAMSEAALSGLPADHAPGGIPMPDGHHTYVYVLRMPAGNPTPYRFVGFDWNPAGHAPPAIYDEPHFDFHFYTITEAERDAIVPTDPRFDEKAAHHPAPEFVPTGYQAIPGAVPLMGAHWVDPTSPELNGQRFTRTFLYGTWDGELIFAEPMITRAFLETKPDVRARVATPSRYAQSGYFATEYRVYWHEPSREYRVALAGFPQQS